MSNEDRIMLKNPNTGRDDLRIRRSMYEPVREAVLDAVEDAGELAFADLRAEVERRTPAGMWDEASVGWYTTAVKLDLEARGLLAREGSPQMLHVTDTGRKALRTTAG